MTSPTIQSYAVSSGESNSAYIPLPTGVVSGDYIFGILRSNSSGLHQIPSGYSQLGSELTIFNYTDTINTGAAFYKISEGIDYTGVYVDIESGKYLSYTACITNATGIKEFRQFNDILDQQTVNTFGCLLRNSGLVINSIGGISPLVGGSYISMHDVPFNGVFHSGVSLYINSGIYGSGYTPIWSLIRPTGSPFLNSGYLEQFPPALFSFGLSVAFN